MLFFSRTYGDAPYAMSVTPFYIFITLLWKLSVVTNFKVTSKISMQAQYEYLYKRGIDEYIKTTKVIESLTFQLRESPVAVRFLVVELGVFFSSLKHLIDISNTS